MTRRTRARKNTRTASAHGRMQYKKMKCIIHSAPLFDYSNCYLWYPEAEPLYHAYFHVDSFLFVLLSVRSRVHLSLDAMWKTKHSIRIKKQRKNEQKWNKAIATCIRLMHHKRRQITKNKFCHAKRAKTKRLAPVERFKNHTQKRWLLCKKETGNWSYSYCEFHCTCSPPTMCVRVRSSFSAYLFP